MEDSKGDELKNLAKSLDLSFGFNFNNGDGSWECWVDGLSKEEFRMTKHLSSLEECLEELKWMMTGPVR